MGSNRVVATGSMHAETMIWCHAAGSNGCLFQSKVREGGRCSGSKIERQQWADGSNSDQQPGSGAMLNVIRVKKVIRLRVELGLHLNN